jgi:hypothetical protein
VKRRLPLALGLVALGIGALVVWLALIEAPVDSPQLSADPIRSLQTVEKLSDHPLYVMHYYGSYQDVTYSMIPLADRADEPALACTLFAALGDPETPVYGRNFDWPRHPVLVLIADPPDAYASISMVDLSFIVPEEVADRLHLLPPEQLGMLLETPLWVFDGMNEHGLAIGMAGVAGTETPYDESVETVSSLEIMRRVLDAAATVDEAIDIFESVNIDMAGGPCTHYLAADAAGDSVLIEFWEGSTYVLRSEEPWACATNYRLCNIDEAARPGICWRYDVIYDELRRTGGSQDPESAMGLLRAAHQQTPDEPEAGTQWSIVYDMKHGSVELAMGHHYDQIFEFRLPIDKMAGDNE